MGLKNSATSTKSLSQSFSKVGGKTNGEFLRWERGWGGGNEGSPAYSVTLSQTEAFASDVQAFKAQLITSLMNVKATDFTVSRKLMLQILCLAVERSYTAVWAIFIGKLCGVLALRHAELLDKSDFCVCALEAQKSLGVYLKILVHCDLVIF